MLYAGFICQQQDVMSSYMSLYVPIFISATVLDSVCQLTYQVQYLLVCQILYPICYVLYAGCRMPRLVCRFIYVECFVLYVKSHMPVAVCLHLYDGTWVPSSSLWVAKLAYMSNCYISVYMPNALFHILYTECNGLYAKLHMLDCDMPNAMTIAMSFRMTTEQVGYFVIYIYI
jgi:hypothetical protein